MQNNMTYEVLQTYCLRKHGAYKEYPFDETTAVFKVGNKMFALIDETTTLLVSTSNATLSTHLNYERCTLKMLAEDII